jgi:ABC-type antimicrobial peptide transport system permease subunit
MLRNFLVIAWRSLIKNRLHTSINVLGLAIGISACMVIFNMVRYELSFNQEITRLDRIYRVYSSFSGLFDGTNRGVTTGVQGVVREQFSGIDKAVRINTIRAQVTAQRLGHEQTFEDEKGIAVVDPEYFDLIPGYEWVEGSPQESLSQPGQVVLSVGQALKYFGTDDVSKIIGQEIRYKDSLHVHVSGLVRLPSYHTDFAFTDFVSHPTIASSFLSRYNMKTDDWGSTNSSNQVFVLLSANTTLAQMEPQLKVLNETYREHNKEMNWFLTYKLQPLDDLHFNSTLGIFDQSREPANRSTLNTLSWIALLLLLIAAINFVNLETAQASRRAREVGVRKVLGSTRKQLVLHFLTQSFLVTGFATLLSIPVSEFALAFFSDYFPQGLRFDVTEMGTLLSLAAIMVMVTLIAGLYPAYGLSSYAPATALKNISTLGSGGSRSALLRKGLIVFQFGFAQVLIICTLVVVSQIDFLINKDLGFKKDAVIDVNAPYRQSGGKRLALRDELRQAPGVEMVSFCAGPPAANGFSSSELAYKPKGKDEVKVNAFRKFGDEQYIPLYEIKLITGRNLRPSDGMKEIVVSEMLLKEIGLTPDEAVGQELWQNDIAFPIVGVVRDFNIMSLAAEFKPVYIACENINFYSYSIRLQRDPESGGYAEAIASVESSWKAIFPDQKFSYQFVDETIRNFYQAEEKMSKLAWTSMIIAILICCLGLFGLASFTSLQRTKEIGIRKVLGASVQSILTLLTSDFLRLVLAAFVMAIPVAIYFANDFLSRYAFHTDLSIGLFAASGLLSLVIAFLTVAYHAIQSATADPVESLRTE